MKTLLAILLAVPSLALAQSRGYTEDLTDSAEALEEALDLVNRTGGNCAAALASPLRHAIDTLDSIRNGTTEWRLNEVASELSMLSTYGKRGVCPRDVNEPMGMANAVFARARTKNPEDGRRRDHRRRGGNDERRPPPPPVVVVRDCGTGEDAGCQMQRNGDWAMDRDVFAGVFASLKGQRSDLTRLDMCKSMFARNAMTAKQLGMVLELFNSDLLRLDAAKVAAPRVVNPQHALGLSEKFRSGLLQRDFTDLMAQQQ